MKKKILMPILAMMLCSTAYAQHFFNVEVKNGETISIAFENSPEVTYPTENSMIIKAQNLNTVYAFLFSEVEKFSYTQDSPAGIALVKADVKIGNGNAVVSGLKAGEKVEIYSVNGQKLGTIKADANGMANVSTGDYVNQTIVVKTPTTSFKVMK